jgi:HlyD family secretion protein
MVKRSASLLFVFLAAALALAACAAPGAGARSGAAATGERVTVQKGSIENRVIATGKVAARTTATVAFPRSGAVVAVLVKEGDAVKAGQPLASLDTRDLKHTAQQQYAGYMSALVSYSQTVQGGGESDLASARASLASAQTSYSLTVRGPTEASLASAKAALASAQAAYNALSDPPSANSVADLKAALDNARASLDQAQFNYDNAYRRDPAGIGASPAGVNLQQATNNYISAKAKYDKAFEKPTASQLASARAQIASAQAQLDALMPGADKVAQAQSQVVAAQTKLDSLTPTTETIQLAQIKLDQTYEAWRQAEDNAAAATILAPFDGVVTAVHFDAGDWMNTGSPAVEIADFAAPIFEVNVDETDLGSVKPDQVARVLLQTYPSQPVSATVQSVASVGSTSGSIVTYKVKLVMHKDSQPQAVILLGMSGTSEIVVANVADALLVPNRALIADSTTKGYSVQRVTAGDKVEMVPVTLGAISQDNAQVLEGLNAGDTLVVPSTTSLQFGPGMGGATGGAQIQP